MKQDSLSYSVYRMLPPGLQSMMVTLAGTGRWLHERSGGFQKIVDSLLEMQFCEKEAMDRYRAERLVMVLKAARTTEFYSPLLPTEREIEADPFGVLGSLPVLGKEDVRSDPGRFISSSFRGKLIRHGTSGTTGTPLQTYWTGHCIDMERALIWRQRIQTGLVFGSTWRGMLGGHRIVPLERSEPPFWRVNRFAKQVYFSTYHMSPENARHYVKAFGKYGIRALEGYPSVLYALARCFELSGLSYELEGAYYGAEPLQDFQRELIGRVFNCYVWDYYGLTERVASASEFPCRNGLHENWENCYCEVVDGCGDPVPHGEYGELAGTSLSNLGFPLLRYRTGDMTRFLPGECACGRASRRIAPVDTKREDLLLMPDGSLLSPSNLTYPFKEVGNILESQLFQEKPEELRVRIIPSAGYSDTDGERLLAGLRELVPGGVAVVLEKVEDIPRTASGKYRFCVSRLTGTDVSRCR